MGDDKPKSKVGLALLSPERRREIASMGGKRAQSLGVGRRWTREQAIEAGRRGGNVVSANREHMADIGRRGHAAKKARREAVPAEEE